LKHRLCLLLLLVLLNGCAGAAKPSLKGVTLTPGVFKARHVFIVVLDGLRHSEGFGDPNARHIPRLAKDLAPQGALCTEFWDDGPTYTLAGHTALTTGFYQDINNLGIELPQHPSLFQYWRQASASAADQAWVVGSKDKLVILGDTQDPAWKGRFTPSLNCGVEGRGFGAGYRDDRDTYAALTTVVAAHHPGAMLVNFKEPDQGGHSGHLKKYLSGVESSDALAEQFWAWLQSEPEFKGHSDVFFTSDHGRHLQGVGSGFQDHGDRCEGCRRVWLLALGPDFKPGLVSAVRGQQIDVPVTAAALLGFGLPGSQGRVLTELLATP
jgi:hypothetical protein